MKLLGAVWPLVLTACGASPVASPVTVDGVPGQFCVPVTQEVQAPWWVPADRPGTPQGFGFAGCWHRPDVADCPFPSNVKGGAVHGLNHSAPRTYGAIPADAFFRTVLTEPDTIFKTYQGGQIVTAQNPRLWDDWYVWEMSALQASSKSIVFNASDRLLAICQAKKSVYAPIAKGQENIFCERSFVSDGLSIKYSFETIEVVPPDLAELDQAVLSTIRGWHCPT